MDRPEEQWSQNKESPPASETNPYVRGHQNEQQRNGGVRRVRHADQSFMLGGREDCSGNGDIAELDAACDAVLEPERAPCGECQERSDGRSNCPGVPAAGFVHDCEEPVAQSLAMGEVLPAEQLPGAAVGKECGVHIPEIVRKQVYGETVDENEEVQRAEEGDTQGEESEVANVVFLLSMFSGLYILSAGPPYLLLRIESTSGSSFLLPCSVSCASVSRSSMSPQYGRCAVSRITSVAGNSRRHAEKGASSESTRYPMG